MAKISILILISAIQSFLFLIIANPILAIKGMFFQYWLALFTTAFCANMLGLNISASFNSAITIYIVIPLLIIPMMILSGAMFPFDKLNREIGNVDKVPVLAELIPTRWTYEALMVSQFKDNRYSKVIYDKEGDTFYDLQKKINEAEFNKVYRLRALRDALETSLFEYRRNPEKTDNTDKPEAGVRNPQYTKLLLLKNELGKLAENYNFPVFNQINDLNPGDFNPEISDSLSIYLDKMSLFFNKLSSVTSDIKDRFYFANDILLRKLENEYFNYKLEEIVTKPYERRKILIYTTILLFKILILFTLIRSRKVSWTSGLIFIHHQNIFLE